MASSSGKGSVVTRWIEIIALIAATAAATPLLVVGVYIAGGWLATILTPGPPTPGHGLSIRAAEVRVGLLCLGGIAGLAGLWTGLLLDRARLRGTAALLVGAGLLAGAAADIGLAALIAGEADSMPPGLIAYYAVLLLVPLALTVRVGRKLLQKDPPYPP